MALLGGGVGGAGNPVGGSFTGPAEALEIVGDYAYSYSGSIGVPNSETTLSSFTTGNFYMVAKWYPGYASESGDNMQFRIKFNDTQIYQTTLDSRLVGSPYQWIELIIPPYTEVLVVCEDKSGSGPVSVTSNITGRIYRTRD